ncbi:MAG: TraR/DksA C4-type zinc finger protein [Candidatus Falkowbacteria bacterium]|nr:TraR/DksA C4-type zinc finger protein [Candidatus Falkowbacteria bacterium]
MCKYCKQEISKERLKARPVASACVSCKIKLQSN